ncbi:hypothetical protein SUGI_0278270 [Cryptomeria japonica]|uniref:ultraviolet-B receptor UVR8 n=1 Tax=Cryptomeria japonica TaxID=3369 RepID=UPI002408D776|nr:ultraviolet-B receptor UVR8 [Cryptomeria japonica]XP_057816551.1 ultraviolet-B receptor UVR8 [Cryptomeria japonica]GLJ16402.1 hypothetical protein SUGI_0278270 [Cryptomeria japonica]
MPMDPTVNGSFSLVSSIQYHGLKDEHLAIVIHPQSFPHQKRHCFGNSSPGESPLFATNPSIILRVLTEYDLDPRDLATLEVTCSFFRQPANFFPDFSLSISEVAALDMCQKRAIFKPMKQEQKNFLKQRCGGSWKLVLQFLKTGERCFRREKCQAIAGPGHSIVVTKSGAVYSFGSNNFGQLGHGTKEDELRPRLIRSLQGIKIIHATAGLGRTILVSDMGQVYTSGRDSFSESEYDAEGSNFITTLKLVDSLDGIFVVQAAIGNFFTAVLSREGKVYTLSWGDDAKLGHHTNPHDQKPHLLKGVLEDIPVVQIAAGYCYLLALTFQPSGMSVYSVGCGLGGKLGHGSRADECYPRLIEQFQNLNLQPIAVAAGTWHAAVVGKDGRVCTWGWGRYGCLGHGNEEAQSVPMVVESLRDIKAVHVATGDYTTFVVAEDGDVYSFGCSESSNLGHLNSDSDDQAIVHENVLHPKLVLSLKQKREQAVHISLTNSVYWNAHTLALTRSGTLYSFGTGDRGQLGTEMVAQQTEKENPTRVDVDLN